MDSSHQEQTFSPNNQMITYDEVDRMADPSFMMMNFLNKNKDEKSFFNDTISDIPIDNQGNFNSAGAIGIRNNRWITFNIPAIDALSRSNPYIRKAANYHANKALINGIDINNPQNKLNSEEEAEVLDEIKNNYEALKDTLVKGDMYGGSAALLWFDGEEAEEDFMKPLIISKIKKNSFLGLKPLARWFQVEPALDKELIKKVGKDTGFSKASMLGMPMYYKVNLSGGMGADQTKKEFLCHASRLLIFNAENPSFIEKQVERYWGPSMVEIAWNELAKDSRLWSATTKSAEKNNLAVLKIDGLALATQVNTNVTNRIEARMGLIKQGTSSNVIPIDSKDDFEFINSVLTGQVEVLKMANSRLAGALNTPVSVLFPSYVGDDEDRSYIQSLSFIQDLQSRQIRPWFDVLLPVIIKSSLGRTVKKVKYSFNPIETQTMKESAETAEINSRTLHNLYQDGFIDKASGIRMLDVLAKSPEFMAQNANQNYKEEIFKKADKGEFITANSDKIEIAKALNQFKKENGTGVSGINNPESDKGGSEGGNPKESKKVIKRNELNPEKGKK